MPADGQTSDARSSGGIGRGLMAFATICDICKLPLVDEATSLQLLPGRLNPTTGGVNMKTIRGAEIYNLCRPCANLVTDHLHHLINGDNIAEVHPDGGACPIADPRAHIAAG